MRHPFENYVLCRDNYFNNPDEIVRMFDDEVYIRDTAYPGLRTNNLLVSSNSGIKDFARWFADKLSVDVFPGISMYEIVVYFHINEIYDSKYNSGWIHNDLGNLAGLVYLTPTESDFESGTSIFLGNGNELPDDLEARKKFHLNGIVTPEYIAGFDNNLSKFKETIKIGNQYNRLIAYDSKMFHRPNSYVTASNQPRKSLLFFISKFDYQGWHEQ